MSVNVISRTRPCLLLLVLILAAPIIAGGAAIGRDEGRAIRVTGDDDPILIPRSVASGSFTLDPADISALEPETTGSVKKQARKSRARCDTLAWFPGRKPSDELREAC
jgi:hypothetical protein